MFGASAFVSSDIAGALRGVNRLVMYWLWSLNPPPRHCDTKLEPDSVSQGEKGTQRRSYAKVANAAHFPPRQAGTFDQVSDTEAARVFRALDAVDDLFHD